MKNLKQMLKSLSNALRRRLDPTLRLMVEVGYLNSSLERTELGAHIFLNFLEAKYEKEFIDFLKARKEEIE